MKKPILLILMIMLACHAHAQMIKGYEYWLDEGYASRVVTPVTPVQIFHLQQNLDLSAAADGLHVFNIRFTDTDNQWSSALSQFMLKLPVPSYPVRHITGYEYWIDENYAGKIYQAVTAAVQYRLAGDIDLSSLPDGIHVFNIRFRDDQGAWSTAISRFFLKITPVTPVTRQVVAYEYWIGENYAGKIYQSVTPAAQVHILENLDLASLPDGVHVMNIRFKDSQGAWSSAWSQFFLKSPPFTPVTRHVAGYEYWVDEDYATRTYLPVTPGIQVRIMEDIDMNAYVDGIHVINIRFKDDTQIWSSALSWFFLKRSPSAAIVPNLLATYRYWFDDDLATMETFQVPATPAIVMLSDTIETPFLNIGNHTINYQFKDTNKVYSSVRTDTFSITTCLPHGGRAIAGTAEVCYGHTGVVYSIRAINNAASYTWSVPTGATIVSGDNTPAITVDFSMSAVSGNVTVYASNPCGNGETMTFPVTVYPAPAPVITGATTVCTGPPGSVYSTEAGNSNYLWTVSPGNTISSGGGTGDATATVTWNATGSQWIRVSYTSAAGCPPSAPTQLNVSVGILPGAAGTITGASNVAPGQMGVAYSVAPVANATGYAWTLPVGVTIATGNNTNSITVDFSLSAVSGNFSVKGTNLCGEGVLSPLFPVVILSNTLNLNKITVGAGPPQCYNAAQTIIVAGGADGVFTVQAGGSATMIAGQNIRFLPVSRVYSGGYLHAYITTTGQFCGSGDNPLVASKVLSGEPDPPIPIFPDSHIRHSHIPHSHIHLFPNPSSGNITIMPTEGEIILPAQVEIFSLTGLRVLQRELESVGKNVISMDGLAPGMYLVHIRSAGWLDVVKVVKE